MQVTFNPYINLGTVAIAKAKSNDSTFKIEEPVVDSKQADIELSRKKHAEFIQSSNAILQGTTPTQLVDTQTNSMTIENGVHYSLGKVNGKPLNGTPLTGGGFNSNFSLMLYCPPGSAGTPLTPEQLQSLRIHQSHSIEERQEANKLVGIFMDLVLIADGSFSTENVNDAEFAQNFPQFAAGIGLDLSKPFYINGKSFEFTNGELRVLASEE
ncbi:hypothetical protein AEA09_15855 [Lysinibacillus contaminans]|uniref:Uncharacterized protein n=1 Tax=Lysinibacillus contaminans TaxID=1293441 RepID=A0ABR5JXL4_9BACI|nr:hypothetical protein [Lysinibacillus contaminans]KOS66972.1 hypothetical protein AEA09_15855 [Lysinibacillus contaminans]